MNTQTEWILADLLAGREITQLSAYADYNCTRLAARISDIRKLGYEVNRRMESRENRFGRRVQYAVYSMEAGA